MTGEHTVISAGDGKLLHMITGDNRGSVVIILMITSDDDRQSHILTGLNRILHMITGENNM